MELKYRKRSKGQVNIVPLVDVLTVLIFFFLVTMQFRENSKRIMNITAPKMQTAGKNAVDQEVLVGISEKGELFLNDAPISIEELNHVLMTAGEVNPDQNVVILADENAPLKHVTDVMDLSRKAKLDKIKLQAR